MKRVWNPAGGSDAVTVVEDYATDRPRMPDDDLVDDEAVTLDEYHRIREEEDDG